MSRRRLAAGTTVLGLLAPLGVALAPTAEAAPTTVHQTGFEGGTDGWFGRGAATVATSTDEARTGAQSLEVTGRTQTWHGPAIDARSFMPAGSYTVEAWVRLPAGSGSDLVTMSVARTPVGGTTAFDTVAWQVPVSDSGWTKVGGPYEYATTNSQLELYLESPDPTQSFYVDDVTIAGEASGPTDPGARQDIETDFEDGTAQGWGPRGDGVVVAPVAGDAHGGTYALRTTNRTQGWHGPTVDVTRGLAVGQTVDVSVWAKLLPGQAPVSLNTTIQRDRGTAQNYDRVAGAVVSADGWTEIRGSYTLGATVDKAQLYVEGPAGVGFLIDDMSLTGKVETPVQDIPGLKDVLGADGIEHVGVAIDQRETVGRPDQLIRRHFSAFTPENDGKPESVQPTEGTFTFGNLDRLLDYADATGTQVYGHVLVWHSQTPAWFFLDGSRPLTDSPADQELLRSRMEAHIKAIADHVNARYPDGDSPIWAWDVVNEVIADSDNDNPHDMRNSRWFQILGEKFVDDAFRLADKYFPQQKLFINDYNTEMPGKRADYLSLIAALEKRGVPIDGVGHQAHVDFARPVEWLDESLTAVEQLDPDLLQVITELDVSNSKENYGADVSNGTTPQHSAAMPAGEAATEVGYYYRDMFAMLRTHAESIESVTFWGISNARSWLRTWPAARPWETPLPFDDDLQAAPAYWGIVDPAKLAPRPADVLPPRIAGSDDVRALSTGVDGAVVRYELPVAGDTRDGAVTPTCTPAPGARFAIGTTAVTCTAEDSSGNAANPTTFDVIVTPPPTTTDLYQNLPRTVRATVGKAVQVPVEFGNAGSGTLLGNTFGYACTTAGGLTLQPGPGAEQVRTRDYPGGESGAFVLRGTPKQPGRVSIDCTLTMTDSFGAEVSDTATVTVDVRR